MSLTIGSHLGPYEVIAVIGAGGMGEVYKARGTKLNRDVALKILADAFASDPDRMARFAREPQTLAALNHPNIAHIRGLEESGGVRALVMELVDGEDLAQRLASDLEWISIRDQAKVQRLQLAFGQRYRCRLRLEAL
jgi:eukaryotic-like serine/threonine-protein kinase